MSTKGASNRYGTKRGKYNKKTNPKGVNFAWAINFNKKRLDIHFEEHAKEFGLDSKESYKQHAIRFANTIDTKNNITYIDYRGSTYKYNKVTHELCIVNKNGIVISYYRVNKNFYYEKNKGVKEWIYV